MVLVENNSVAFLLKSMFHANSKNTHGCLRQFLKSIWWHFTPNSWVTSKTLCLTEYH